MRLHSFLYVACLSMIALVGCSTVSSTAPLGDPASADDAKKLEGVWLTGAGEPVWVRYVKDNELRVAGLDWRDSKYKLSEFTIFVTQDDDKTFVNATGDESSPEPQSIIFARVSAFEGESLVLFGPRADAFANAIKAGTLPGKITHDNNREQVHLEATTEQLSEFVAPEKTGEQFNIDAGVVLHRVRRFEDKSQ